jgi:hypothetical protein
MTKFGLYTVKKAGLVFSGLALNFLLVALLLLSTSSAHAEGRGWRADRHGGYFNNRSHWKAAGSRHVRRNWGLNRGGFNRGFNRGWGHSAWRGARHRNNQIFIGGAVSAFAGGLLYSNTLHRPARSVTVVHDFQTPRIQSVPTYYSPSYSARYSPLNSQRLVSTPRPIPLVSQSSIHSTLPTAASSSASTAPATRWLLDLAGNCYRITTNAAGEELREQRDAAACTAF